MNMGMARIAAIALLPALLSGCVAALIPVAAGGMMAGKEKIGIGAETKAEPAEANSVADEMKVPGPTPKPDPIVVVENPPPALTPIDEPAPAAPSPMSSYQAFAGIFGYAVAQADIDPVSEPRQSALLAAPGSLVPDRSDCSIRPPAVIFDLDPDGAVFAPAIEAAADPALVQMLRAFRMQEISIFWVSALPALDAGSVRRRLQQSGLDLIGRDGLLLMRRADDRKQTRRRELSETHCVIAIAGDTKSDFDELYDYLMDPSAAGTLDELLDAGWFLTPLPLLDPNTTEGQ